MRYIDDTTASSLITMKDCVDLVEECFLTMGKGTAFNTPRTRARIPKGALQILPAAIPHKDVIGFKAYTSFKGGVKFKTYLYSATDGELLAIVDSNILSRMRTGAASAVATKFMSNKDSSVMTVFGAGSHALDQIEAIKTVRPISKVNIINRTADNGIQFASIVSNKFNITAEYIPDYRDAINNSDIITTITSASSPLFDDILPVKGVHINAAGSNALTRSEIGEKVLRKADIIAVDDKEVAKLECGDLLPLLEKGRIHFNTVLELGDIVAGFNKGRNTSSDITVFESQGLGIQDVITAHFVYEKAIKCNCGKVIEL